MPSFVPNNFWADRSIRKLTPAAQLVYLWVCCKADNCGVLSPWDPVECSMEIFGTKFGPDKAEKLIRSCDKAGTVLVFEPSPQHGDYDRAVAVSRWASVAPHVATKPASGDPYPSEQQIQVWEKSRKSTFKFSNASKERESEPSNKEMELALDVWSHWVSSRSAARSDATPAILDKNRIMHIVRFLRKHVTVQAMKLAVDGCFSSPWHMGQNPRNRVYDQVELIFKDAAHFERFVDLGRMSKGKSDEDYMSSVMREMRERKRRIRSKKSAIPNLQDFED